MSWNAQWPLAGDENRYLSRDFLGPFVEAVAERCEATASTTLMPAPVVGERSLEYWRDVPAYILSLQYRYIAASGPPEALLAPTVTSLHVNIQHTLWVRNWAEPGNSLIAGLNPDKPKFMAAGFERRRPLEIKHLDDGGSTGQVARYLGVPGKGVRPGDLAEFDGAKWVPTKAKRPDVVTTVVPWNGSDMMQSGDYMGASVVNQLRDALNQFSFSFLPYAIYTYRLVRGRYAEVSGPLPSAPPVNPGTALNPTNPSLIIGDQQTLAASLWGADLGEHNSEDYTYNWRIRTNVSPPTFAFEDLPSHYRATAEDETVDGDVVEVGRRKLGFPEFMQQSFCGAYANTVFFTVNAPPIFQGAREFLAVGARHTGAWGFADGPLPDRTRQIIGVVQPVVHGNLSSPPLTNTAMLHGDGWPLSPFIASSPFVSGPAGEMYTPPFSFETRPLQSVYESDLLQPLHFGYELTLAYAGNVWTNSNGPAAYGGSIIVKWDVPGGFKYSASSF